METDTTDLASQLTQWTQRLNERQEALQSELQRLQTFRNDYDALEKTLCTLPDQTTRSAMIPIGKLAFMPGKLIHTNEITVYLGDQYYAERSAKQALGILERRKEVVDENLRLIEAQVNALQTKSEAGQGSIPASDLGVNEEGLPIVEIREELPEEKAPAAAESNKALSKPTAEPTAKTWTEKEQKDVMAMLQRLEEEEEKEEDDELEQDNQKQKSSEDDAKDGDEDGDEEDWDRYDTEIADNLFDHFEDDEDYATQGIVDQVDATAYEEEDFQDPELDEQQTLEAVTKQQTPETVTERRSSAVDESPLKERVAEKKPEPKLMDAASETGAIPTPPKARKPSRFKVAKQKERTRPSAVAPAKKDDADQSPKAEKQVVEAEIPAVLKSPKDLPKTGVDHLGRSAVAEQPASRNVPAIKESSQESADSAKASDTKKKVSRFKLAREQERNTTTAAPSSPNTTATATPSKERKPSKFKLTRQHGKARAPDAGIDFAVAVEKIPAVHDTRKPSEATKEKPADEKPKRKVTWDEVATVQEHDRSAAPSTVSSDSASPSYTAPVKEEQSSDKDLPLRPRVIKSPADIFSALQDQRQILLDDGYPSLETGEDDIHSGLDINTLTKDANFASQEIWQLRDEPRNPLIMPIKESEVTQNPQIRKTKLDSITMKGAVMERETEPVDLDAVEQDMDLREVTSRYHSQRNSMMAAMGGYSFEQKDVYEVYDEDIPTHQDGLKESAEEEPEEKPRKVSRFKAARMAAIEKSAQ